MNFLIDDNVLKFNQLGIIPGPQENYEDFISRAHYCLKLRHEFKSKLERYVPFANEKQVSNEVMDKALLITESLYGIKPDWIPIFFSNYKLTFWHGGCAWIFQENETTPIGAFLQLRRVFKKSEFYLKLYNRNELIAHECAHVGRMMFEEPRFEEVFAYRSDHSAFRRYFGPIMESSWESALFVLFLSLILILDFSLSSLMNSDLYQHFMWLKLVPCGMLLYAFIRLYKKQKQFHRCLVNLRKLVKNNKNADAIIYRLTDQEIFLFAKNSTEKILDYIHLNKDKTLRWKVITTTYLEDLVN
jgi:hypothetical protein